MSNKKKKNVGTESIPKTHKVFKLQTTGYIKIKHQTYVNIIINLIYTYPFYIWTTSFNKHGTMKISNEYSHLKKLNQQMWCRYGLSHTMDLRKKKSQ